MGPVQVDGERDGLKKPGVLFLAFLLSLLPSARAASAHESPTKPITQYSLDSWQVEDGLPQNSVSSVVQTKEGYLWLGTLEGLVRFDGAEFTVFDERNTPAFRSDRILSLFVDREGTLWIGTEDGGLVNCRLGQFTYAELPEGPPYNGVTGICQDSHGTLWVGTSQGGLYTSAGGTSFRRYALPGILGNSITALCVDGEGDVWAGTDDGALHLAKSWSSLTVKQGLPSNRVVSLCPDPSNPAGVWVGTSRGLSRFDGKSVRTMTAASGLTNNFIWSLRTLRDGSVLAGTQGGGLNLIRNWTVTSFGTKDGLTNDFVWSIFEDAERNIWIGTNGGGLNRLTNGSFTSFTEREGLSNNFVWSICEDPRGGIWAGTYMGLNYISNGVFRRYSTGDGLPNNFVWSVYADSKGNVWAGTADGLGKLRDGRWTTYSTANGLGSSVIRALCETKRGDIWIGTTGGLSRYRDGSFVSYGTRAGLSSDLVMALLEGNDGALWIGTAAGLDRMKDGKIEQIGDGNSPVIIRSIYQDAGHNLWVGTQGAGLELYREGKTFRFTTRNGLLDDVISEILEDAHGNLWMSCNNGVFCVRKEELFAVAGGQGVALAPVAYGRADGMMSRECNGSSQPAGCRTRDGKMWFPTIRGIAMVDPAGLRINQVPPPVIIERVSVDHAAKNVFAPVEAPPGSGNLQIHYTGLSFIAPERMQFKYMLEGFDEDWVQAGGRRDAYYTNLPPARYTFRVKACNNDGVWNESGDLIRIDLRPHYYQRSWFQILCGLAVLSLGFGAYRYRTRRMRARESKLVSLVVERTKHLQEEKEIAESARTESERQREIAQEANKVKTELLNIAAHDLKSPLVSIKMLAKIIIEEAKGTGPLADFASDIFSSAQRMHGLVSELLESAWIESGNLALKRKHVDLSRLADLVVMDNQVTAAQKGQRIVFTPQTGCIVVGDEERLREAFDNLVSNAIKYSPLEKVILVDLKDCRHSIRLEVRDEGPGLTEEDKQRVFGKFQKLSAAPTGGEASTGLGLSIVKQLIEAHDGRVGVESAYGEGSTFIVELPKAEM